MSLNLVLGLDGGLDGDSISLSDCRRVIKLNKTIYVSGLYARLRLHGELDGGLDGGWRSVG